MGETGGEVDRVETGQLELRPAVACEVDGDKLLFEDERWGWAFRQRAAEDHVGLVVASGLNKTLFHGLARIRAVDDVRLWVAWTAGNWRGCRQKGPSGAWVAWTRHYWRLRRGSRKVVTSDRWTVCDCYYCRHLRWTCLLKTWISPLWIASSLTMLRVIYWSVLINYSLFLKIKIY